jgi:hypothetical protein
VQPAWNVRGSGVVAIMIAATAPVMAQRRAPVPDAQTQAAAQKVAGELYGGRFRQAKTVAETTALATEMIDAALKVKDGSADQFVLLKIARDMAAGAGDGPTALRAVAKTAKGFGSRIRENSGIPAIIRSLTTPATRNLELLAFAERKATTSRSCFSRESEAAGQPPACFLH